MADEVSFEGVLPYVKYEDAGAMLDWLSRVFGFEERANAAFEILARGVGKRRNFDRNRPRIGQGTPNLADKPDGHLFDPRDFRADFCEFRFIRFC